MLTSVFMGSLSSQSYTILVSGVPQRMSMTLLKKQMRMINIGEVGGTHEHVLFRPTEPLRNLIAMLLSVVPPLQLSDGMLSDYSIATDTSSSMSFRCFVTIEDDEIPPSMFHE